jgi:hypothetical protein
MFIDTASHSEQLRRSDIYGSTTAICRSYGAPEMFCKAAYKYVAPPELRKFLERTAVYKYSAPAEGACLSALKELARPLLQAVLTRRVWLRPVPPRQFCFLPLSLLSCGIAVEQHLRQILQ